MQQIQAVMDPLHIFLPQGLNKEAKKTGHLS